MGTSFLLFESYFYIYSEPIGQPGWDSEIGRNHGSSATNHEGMKSTMQSFIIYSIVTTIISCFGVFGNIISLTVLRRKELVGSVYTYLAVLAATDLALSITFFLGGLVRGALYYTDWAIYDAIIGLPLGGTINSIGVSATVCVTIDRVLYLWQPVQCSRPKFCNPKTAKILMGVSFVICILINVPYWFIFEKDKHGTLRTSMFFQSRTFSFYNWFMLILLTIIPGIILILGNGFLIMSLQKVRRITKKCNGKRRKDRNNLTITLISIIILFLVTEIPSNLVSRTRAVNLIFFGNHVPSDSDVMEIIRAICTVLGAVNVTINFLFYYLFCPSFCRAMRLTFMKATSKKNEKIRVNVIVLNENSQKMVKVLKFAKISVGSPLHKNSGELKDSETCFSKQIESEYVEIIDGSKEESSNFGDYDKAFSTASTVRLEEISQYD